MRKLAIAMLLTACAAAAQVRTISLRQAVELALKQNPDLALARLDERKSEEAVRLARDPFYPKVAVGSGLAYSNGIPLSMAGATPSIFQGQATQSIFSRQQAHLIAAARENVRGAAIDTAVKSDDVVLRTALVYLQAERAARLAETARKQLESLAKVAETVRLRVGDGRELPVETKRADLDLARARQRVQDFEAERLDAERSLSLLLGLDAGEPVRVVVEDRAPTAAPESEEACVQAALEGSKEVRRLESALTAKGFDISAQKAAKLPSVDLVAQYALLGRFNNYDDFFNKFQRHNGQIGVSFQIPLFTGTAVDAQVAQATGEAARLRLELQSTRNRLAMESRRLFQQVRQAESGREVARLDLEVSREELSILLARMEEGRASLREVEQARLAEDDKWMAFIDANYNLETARLNLLHRTGALLSSIK